jgi:hypothetical protein
LAGSGGDDVDEEVVVVAVDDDGNEEDTDDKDNDKDGNALSSSSILFSKMKFHINGSAFLRNDCVFISSPFKRGGVVINNPFLSFCSSIFGGDCIIITPIRTA